MNPETAGLSLNFNTFSFKKQLKTFLKACDTENSPKCLCSYVGKTGMNKIMKKRENKAESGITNLVD